MGFVGGAWLFVLGVLGAANLIIARKPEAKELIGKIAPYQGWIGFVSMIWGVWEIIHAVLNIGWLGDFPIWWITYLATGVLQAALGVLLGVGVFKTFVKQEQAVEKMDQLVAKLSPFQGTLGLIAMGVGIWSIISTVLFR
jgi:hypothetical protein